MERLTKQLNEAKTNIANIQQELHEARQKRQADEKKLYEIGDSIRIEYRSLIGEEAAKLRQSEWTNWRGQDQAPEYIDNLVTDLVDKFKISKGSIEETIAHKERALQRKKDENKQLEKELLSTEDKINHYETEIRLAVGRELALQKEAQERSLQNTNLQTERAEARGQIAKLEDEIANIKLDKEAVLRSRASAIEAHSVISCERAALLIAREDLSKEIVQRQEQLDELQERMDKAVESSGQARLEIQAKNAKILSLNEKLEAEQNKRRDLEDQVREFQRDDEPQYIYNVNQNLYQEMLRLNFSTPKAKTCGPTHRNNDNGTPHTPRTHSEDNWDYQWLGPEPNKDTSKHERKEKQPRTMEELLLLAGKMVPLFDGGSSPMVNYELDRYLEGCEAMRENVRLGEKPIMTRCFKMRLTGEAHQEIHLDNIETYEQLKTRLKELYMDSQSYDDFNNDLRSCKQLPGENTRQFLRRVDTLHKMTRRASETIYSKPEEQKVHKDELERVTQKVIREGLSNKDTRRHLLTIRANGLKDLMQSVERYEKGLAEIGGPSDGAKIQTVNAIQDSAYELRELIQNGFQQTVDAVGRITNQLGQHEGRINGVESTMKEMKVGNEELRSMVQSLSQGDGLFSRECGEPKISQGSNCFYCHKPNHNFRICAAKNREEQLRRAEEQPRPQGNPFGSVGGNPAPSAPREQGNY